MNYRERINHKIEYAEVKAAELSASSDAFFSKSVEDHTGIPCGQPILVGHHSEGRHRRAIEMFGTHVKGALEDADKAKFYAERAERLKSNSVISSDNPEAVNLLKTKLAALEAQREKMKGTNAAWRKHLKGDSEPLKALFSDENIIKLTEKVDKAYSWEKQPYAAWQLSNLAGNITTIKERIARLEKVQQIEEKEEVINGVTIKIDKEDNRVRLLFDGIPEQAKRETLKRNGFRWSPLAGAWQRQLSPIAIRKAKGMAEAEFKEGWY